MLVQRHVVIVLQLPGSKHFHPRNWASKTLVLWMIRFFHVFLRVDVDDGWCWGIFTCHPKLQGQLQVASMTRSRKEQTWFWHTSIAPRNCAMQSQQGDREVYMPGCKFVKQQSRPWIVGFCFDLSLSNVFHPDLAKPISFCVGGSYAVATQVSLVREGVIWLGPRD